MFIASCLLGNGFYTTEVLLFPLRRRCEFLILLFRLPPQCGIFEEPSQRLSGYSSRPYCGLALWSCGVYFLPTQLLWPALNGIRYRSNSAALTGSNHRSGTYLPASSPKMLLFRCNAWLTIETVVPPGIWSPAISRPPSGTRLGNGITKTGVYLRFSLIHAWKYVFSGIPSILDILSPGSDATNSATNFSIALGVWRRWKKRSVMVVAVVWEPATMKPKASVWMSTTSNVCPVCGSFASIRRANRSVRFESFWERRRPTQRAVSYISSFIFWMMIHLSRRPDLCIIAESME